MALGEGYFPLLPAAVYYLLSTTITIVFLKGTRGLVPTY